MKQQKANAGKVAKVPVILQMENIECGPASLAMILAYHGKWVSLDTLRQDCGASRDGVSASALIHAAQKYGLAYKAFKLDRQELCEMGIFPCIVLLNTHHFIVVNGFLKDGVSINDPAAGRIKMDFDRFDKLYANVALLLEPTPAFVPGGKPLSVLAFAQKRLRNAKKAILFSAIAATLAALFAFLRPAFSRVLVDRLLTDKNPDWLYPMLGLMAFLAILEIVVSYLKRIYSLKIEGKLAVSSNTSFLWHVLHLPMPFFSSRMVGDILLRQSSNTSIATTFINVLTPLLLNLCLLAVYLVVLVRNSLLLTAIGVAGIVVNSLTSLYISRKQLDSIRVQQRNAGRKNNILLNGIRIMPTIKASGAEHTMFDQWASSQASQSMQTTGIAKQGAYMGGFAMLVSSLCDIAIIATGVFLIFEGSLTVGVLVAFQGFLSQLKSPADTIRQGGQTLQAMQIDVERIEDIMQYPEAPAATSEVDYSQWSELGGDVSIADLSFRYAQTGPLVIEGISLALAPGRRVALVGASGSGKSTVGKLMAGLYPPTGGTILYGQTPIEQIPTPVLRSSLSYVDQDIVIFADTIFNNITLWDSTISEADVMRAAKDACLHHDIIARPGGYECLLSPDGNDLSGGQRQRLEIARALALNPSILILDEATSALDAQTEYEIIEAVKRRNIAVLLIAHRLSTICDCDEIIVLSKGRVAERGTHDTLYAQRGLYFDLVNNE